MASCLGFALGLRVLGLRSVGFKVCLGFGETAPTVRIVAVEE